MEWEHVEHELTNKELISAVPLTGVLKAIVTKVDTLSRSHSESQLTGQVENEGRDKHVKESFESFSSIFKNLAKEVNELRNHMQTITEEKIDLQQELKRVQNDLGKQLENERNARMAIEEQYFQLNQGHTALKATVDGMTSETPRSARKSSQAKIILPSVNSEGSKSRPGSAKTERPPVLPPLAIVDNDTVNRKVETLERELNDLKFLLERNEIQKAEQDSAIEKLRKILEGKVDTATLNEVENQIKHNTHENEIVKIRTEEKISELASQVSELEQSLVKKAERKELHDLMEKMSNETQVNTNSMGTFSFENGSITDEKQASDVFHLHANQLKQLMKTKADKVEVYKEISEKGEAIDRLEQIKADSSIVARKAEREYVDGMMDRSRKEIEQLISSTNANTADLFAKDLEYLKILIDEKSSVKEFKALRDMLLKGGNEKSDGLDGNALAGKMRCLSCNQELQSGMKVRPTSMSFTGFMSQISKQPSTLPQRIYQKKTVASEVLRKVSPPNNKPQRPMSSGGTRRRPQTAGSLSIDTSH